MLHKHLLKTSSQDIKSFTMRVLTHYSKVVRPQLLILSCLLTVIGLTNAQELAKSANPSRAFKDMSRAIISRDSGDVTIYSLPNAPNTKMMVSKNAHNALSNVNQAAPNTVTTTADALMSAPSCISAPGYPANGQIGVCPAFTVSWTAVSGATGYKVYLDLYDINGQPTDANLAYWYTISGTSAGPFYTSENRLIYWKIVPVNADGETTGCPIWSFTLGTWNRPTVQIMASSGSSICAGTPVTFTATPSNGNTNAKYAWYNGYTDLFGTIVPNYIAGETGSTFTRSNLANGDKIGVQMQQDLNICASFAQSNEITMTVTPPVTPSVSLSSSVADNTICAGTPVTFTATPTNGGTTPMYKWTINGGTVQGETSATLTSSSLADGDKVQVELTSNDPCASPKMVSSDIIMMTVKSLSVAPTSITGTTTICTGQETTLTVVGGTIGTNAIAKWFTAECGGLLAGTGNSITVSPTTKTTYFVRYEGTCNTTACASQTVTVKTPSVVPTDISGTTIICNGGSTTLTVNGGTLGTNAIIEWFSGSCSGSPIGTGSTLMVSNSGTYYVHYKGDCNTTDCITQTISFKTPSVAPTSITGTTTICNGGSTTLTVNGGILGTNAIIEWFSGSCSGSPIGTGSTLMVSNSGTYYVHYKGDCNTTDCISQTVSFKTPSVAPTGIAGTTTICKNGSTTLTVTGGTLGTGGIVKWFTGSCSGTAAGTGNSINVNPATTTTYFVRYESDCGNSDCFSKTVTVDNPSVDVTNCAFVYKGYDNNYGCTTITAVATGAGLITYKWSSNQTTSSINVCPTINTTYTVTTTDANGCKASDNVTVKVVDVSCDKNKVNVCHNGLTICIAKTDVSFHLAHGDKLGKCGLVLPCGSNASAVANTANTLQSKSLEDTDEMLIYPNPVQNILSVQLTTTTEGSAQIALMDITGKIVITKKQNLLKGLNEVSLDVSKLSAGMYLIQYTNAEQQVQTVRIVKE